jgi:hypothetical protein
MKHLARILSLLILVSATVFFAACDKGDPAEKSEKEVQIEKLVGEWNISTVTKDGAAQTADYTGFKITFTKSSSDAISFTTANRPAGKATPWDANGTFTFGNPVATVLLRDDDVTVQYNVSGTSLTLTLEDYSGLGYTARPASVEGDWVFTFTK